MCGSCHFLFVQEIGLGDLEDCIEVMIAILRAPEMVLVRVRRGVVLEEYIARAHRYVASLSVYIQ
ncbi:hypothetical protein D3C85_1853510 [compost metagenome]